jgi:hypothetical protein
MTRRPERRGAGAVCKGCGRALLWARSANGAWLPLEAVRAYEVVALGPPGPGQPPPDPRATVLTRATYVSHFLTCPERQRFSGASRRKEPPA